MEVDLRSSLAADRIQQLECESMLSSCENRMGGRGMGRIVGKYLAIKSHLRREPYQEVTVRC